MAATTSEARRRTLIATVGSVAAAAAPTRLLAVDGARYPDRQVRIVVPFPPGGSVDVLARTVAQQMTEHWKQPVIVESRPGASTMIGTDAVAKAKPDGYSLLIAVSNHTTNPALHDKLPYDTLRDLLPVSLLARTPIVCYCNPAFAPRDLRELVAFAKAKPGELSFGSAGTGSMTHLVAELLKLKAGIDMTHVVYKGGTPALNDVVAGHIPLTFATVGQALPQYRAGQVRALGVSSAARWASIPEVPTFREQGVDVVGTEWFGLMTTAGTPKAVIDALNAEARRIVAMPDLGDRLNAIEPVASSPAELDAFIRSEMARWSPLIKQLGISAS